jgi:glycosyltransferase involved in cell wall biosynthesis
MKVGFASGDYLPAQSSSDGVPHWGGSGWARLGQYVEWLEHFEKDVLIGVLTWNRDHFCIRGVDDKLTAVDVIVMQRLMHDSLSDHIAKARSIGQIVINDLDDWYWGLDPANDAFLSSHPKTNPKENRDHYKKVLASSNVVTVSTPYLADRIKSFVHCPILIIENTVDIARFTPHNHTDSSVPVVGWVGATSHRSSDLEIMKGIINPLLANNEIKFHHSGHYSHAPSVASKLGLHEDQITVMNAVGAKEYPSLLTMDVGIAPLRDTPFNHAKSDIKLLEYSASGIPWVGSSLSAYEGLRKSWGIGRTASKPSQWLKHLRDLKDPVRRADEGEALREAVRSRDISLGAHRLNSLIEDIA